MMPRESVRTNPRAAGSGSGGFTLVEMLVVLGLVVLATVLLVSVLLHARAVTQRTRCMTNLHRIGIAVISYAVDNQRMLPTYYCASTIPFDTFLMRRGTGDLVNLGLVVGYVKDPDSFYCPTQDRESSPSIAMGVQDAKWQEESVALSPDHVDAAAQKIRLPQPGANSSYPPRSREFEPDRLPRWTMLNYANKIIYSDFIGVDEWPATGRFSGVLNAPHDGKGCNRLFGDGSVSWAGAKPVNDYRQVGLNVPSTKDLKDYYELLDVLP